MGKFIEWTAGTIAAFIVFNSLSDVLIHNKMLKEVEENGKKYEEEIDLYNEYITEYAKYVKSLNLSDTEIIMKVMNDIWSEIDGYGKPYEIIPGYYRLSFYLEGKGVCTSFADDFTARINKINSKYEARNIVVYIKDDVLKNSDVDMCDIERTILSEDNSSELSEKEKKEQKKFGNHMVSLIKIPEHNIELVVDPTNLFIGIFKDGKIDILNSSAKDEMDFKKTSTYYLKVDDFEYLDGDIKISDEKIEDLYGVDAQKESLDKVDDIPKLILKKEN